jgi:hypothetical protein
MGYCSKSDIENVIAQALTSATSSTTDEFGTLANLLNVGNVIDNNLITDTIVNAYIQIADREIDATLSQLYKTPLNELANLENRLFSAIDEYNEYIVLESAVPLSPGDIIILISGTHEERNEIDEVIDATTFSTVSPIQYHFPIGTRVIRVSYPDPIRFISARQSAANIYDKYFSSESSPNTSKFEQYLREIARQELNNILNGRTILHGQERIGRRFYNANLVEQYDLPRSAEGAKDIDNLTKG